MEIARFDVFVVALDPTIGKEIRKSCPCVVISPNEMNSWLATVIVAPLTTKGREYPTRLNCQFKGKRSQIVLDQIRTVDKARLVKKLGRLENKTGLKTLTLLQEMFAS